MDPKNPPPRISAAGLLGPDLVCAQMEEDIGGMDLMPGRSLVKFDQFISFHVKELP